MKSPKLSLFVSLLLLPLATRVMIPESSGAQIETFPHGSRVTVENFDLEFAQPRKLIMVLKNSLTCIFVLCLFVSPLLAQQDKGSIKGTVTDPLGSLVVDANVILKDARGLERKTTTNSSGVFEFRSLPAGKYELRVVAVGFDLLEDALEVSSRQTTTADLQLTIASVEQSVTVEQKGVSTDSDRNADAMILRGRDLEALPDDPAALLAALQAMAGPNLSNENGGAPQVKVDGFSNGQMPPKEAIREIRVNQNPFQLRMNIPVGAVSRFSHNQALRNFTVECRSISMTRVSTAAIRLLPKELRSNNVPLTAT